MSHIESELTGYQFGTLGEETRRRVEEHLIECPECVKAFVEIKRAIETSEAAPAPSDAARARLRRAVKSEMGIAERTWWERPIAFALAASVVLAATATMHALTTTDASPPYALRK
jgi:anti-sigma factor RsiW